jgi:aspartate kinase
VTGRIEKERAEEKAVVVAGFQGVDGHGDVTTIGRGGSDTTAAALAGALSADSCVIYTDVKGVFTADPRIVPHAVLLDEVDYDDMLLLSSLGAGVLHDRSVETAKRSDVVLKVTSSFEKGSGTKIKKLSQDKGRLCGAAADKNAALMTVAGIAAEDAEYLLRSITESGIAVDMIAVSGGRLSFSVHESKADETEKLASERLSGAEKLSRNDGLAKVSLVGGAVSESERFALRMKERLAEEHLPVYGFFSGKRRVSVLVPRDDADKTLRAVHDEFFEKATKEL